MKVSPKRIAVEDALIQTGYDQAVSEANRALWYVLHCFYDQEYEEVFETHLPIEVLMNNSVWQIIEKWKKAKELLQKNNPSERLP